MNVSNADIGGDEVKKEKNIMSISSVSSDPPFVFKIRKEEHFFLKLFR